MLRSIYPLSSLGRSSFSPYDQSPRHRNERAMHLEWYARTEIGRIRASNQDAIGCYPDLGLFAVADGMGGHESGEVASRMAVESLRGFFSESAAVEGARLPEAVGFANREIFDAGRPAGRTTTRPMGTTVVALLLSAEARRIAWVHVGDSRLYRHRDDHLELLTADHTRFGARFADGAEIPLDLPHTNELHSALGIEANVSPSGGSADWKDDDLYLLCSDGISGLISPLQLRTELAAPTTLEEIGTRLIQRALEAGGSDNASVILVRTAR